MKSRDNDVIFNHGEVPLYNK